METDVRCRQVQTTFIPPVVPIDSKASLKIRHLSVWLDTDQWQRWGDGESWDSKICKTNKMISFSDGLLEKALS